MRLPLRLPRPMRLPPLMRIGPRRFLWRLTPCVRCQGVINVNDLLAVLGDYGKRTDISKTDSNADGVINVSDLLTLLANYGATCDAGAHAMPSPHFGAAPACPPSPSPARALPQSL